MKKNRVDAIINLGPMKHICKYTGVWEEIKDSETLGNGEMELNAVKYRRKGEKGLVLRDIVKR